MSALFLAHYSLSATSWASFPYPDSQAKYDLLVLNMLLNQVSMISGSDRTNKSKFIVCKWHVWFAD